MYVSSKRAAEITGYAKDYVGQLCREGHVEARMVGRSWYVLETSIREHRFGKEEVQDRRNSTEKPATEEKTFPQTWEAPRYTAEPVPAMPEMRSVPQAKPEIQDQTLSEMQSAWKEWFEKTRKEPLLEAPGAHEDRLESPEVIEERWAHVAEDAPIEEEVSYIPSNEPVFVPQEAEAQEPESEEVEIPFTKVEEQRPVEVPIRRFPGIRRQSAPMNTATEYEAYRSGKGGRNLVATASLIAVAFVAIAIGFIGTGYASQYVGNNPVVQYLGGASTIQK